MNEKQSTLLGLIAVFIAALTLVYWNHFDNGFHFDDNHTIVNNGYITDIGNLPLFFIDSRTQSSLPENQSYRPVITSLNAIDYWVAGGLNSVVFHWHIYLEFLLLLVFLYLVILKVFAVSSGQKHYYLALFATAFFAFHTATAETLNYIIARSDGFSTLMVLAGMLIYISNTSWKKQLGLIPFLLGCLAKPTTLMLAPLLVVYSLLLETPSLTVRAENPAFTTSLLRTINSTTSYFLIGLGMYLFTRTMYSDTWIPGGNSVLHYLNTQPYVIFIYLKTFILPTGLSADTDLKIITEFLAPRVLLGLFVILVLLLAAWFSSRKRITLPISYGILWFFICLTPTSSLIPLSEVLNHHRTFLPYIGLVMAATWSIYLLVRRLRTEVSSALVKYALPTMGILFLSFHAYGTYQRNEVWDSDLSLWYDVTIKSPENGRGLMNYGLAEMRRGNMQMAINYYEKAQGTDYGRHAYLYINLGIATNALSDRNGDQQLKVKAEKYYKTALRYGAHYPNTHYYFADWLHKNKRSSAAFPYAKKAIELSPAHKPARELMQKISIVTSQELEFAKVHAEILNTPEAYLNLSLQSYNLGEYENCIEASINALKLRPNYASAYNNICSANNMLGNFDLAIEACERALLIDPNHARAQGNLNWARSRLNPAVSG